MSTYKADTYCSFPSHTRPQALSRVHKHAGLASRRQNSRRNQWHCRLCVHVVPFGQLYLKAVTLTSSYGSAALNRLRSSSPYVTVTARCVLAMRRLFICQMPVLLANRRPMAASLWGIYFGSALCGRDGRQLAILCCASRAAVNVGGAITDAGGASVNGVIEA